MREGASAVHVTNGEGVVNVGSQHVIDGDVAALVRFDPGRLHEGPGLHRDAGAIAHLQVRSRTTGLWSEAPSPMRSSMSLQHVSARAVTPSLPSAKSILRPWFDANLDL